MFMQLTGIWKKKAPEIVTLYCFPPMSGSPQNVAKLQAERKMMGFIVSTPPGWWGEKTSPLFRLEGKWQHRVI